MIVIKASVATKAKPATIWNRWIDFASWTEWNPSLVSAKLTGGLRVGARGELCMKKSQTAEFEVVRVEHDKVFDLVSQVWGGTLTFSQQIEVVGGMQRMTIVVTTEGWASWIYGFSMRYLLRKELPACLTKLALLVEADQVRVEQDLYDARFKNQ